MLRSTATQQPEAQLRSWSTLVLSLSWRSLRGDHPHWLSLG